MDSLLELINNHAGRVVQLDFHISAVTCLNTYTAIEELHVHKPESTCAMPLIDAKIRRMIDKIDGFPFAYQAIIRNEGHVHVVASCVRFALGVFFCVFLLVNANGALLGIFDEHINHPFDLHICCLPDMKYAVRIGDDHVERREDIV